MATRKTQPKKKTTAAKATAAKATTGDARSDALAQLIPSPPPGQDEEKLSVDIPTQLCWRLKLALLALESRGEKTPKKKFVEQALASALDRLDFEWGNARG